MLTRSYGREQIAAGIESVMSFFVGEMNPELSMWFGALMTSGGFGSIERLDLRSEVTGGSFTLESALWLDGSEPESFLQQWTAIPDRQWQFPELFADEDYLYLAAISSFKEKTRLFTEHRLNMGNTADQLEIGRLLWPFRGPLLAGSSAGAGEAVGDEAVFVVFGVPGFEGDISSPLYMNAAVLAPVGDPASLREYLELCGEAADFEVDNPRFTSGEWSFYPLSEGSTMALCVSPEWLAVSTNFIEFGQVMRRAPGRQRTAVAGGSMCLRVNLNRVYREIGVPYAAVRKSRPELLEAMTVLSLLTACDEAPGWITLMEQHGEGKCVSTCTMDGGAYQAMGLMTVAVGADSLLELFERVLIRYVDETGGLGDGPPDEEEPLGGGGRDDDVPIADGGRDDDIPL